MTSRVLVVGAGAVGGPLAAWLHDAGVSVAVLARGATADRLEREGIAWAVDEGGAHGVGRPRVIRSLEGEPAPDVALLGVKTPALGAVTKALLDAYGPKLPVASLLNGIEAHRLLPEAFPNSVAAIVHWNAWTEPDGVHRLVRRGSLVVAPMQPQALDAARAAATILARGNAVTFTERGRDAALCKMVFNLAGSLQTLTAFHARPPDDPDALQWALTSLVHEGLEVIGAAGAREVRVPGTPSFALLRLSAHLPRWLTGPVFRKNLSKMRVSSLAQDVARGVRDTELDAIHGELVRMADEHGLRVPVMRTVLRELEQRLAAPTFVPLPVGALRRAVEAAGC